MLQYTCSKGCHGSVLLRIISLSDKLKGGSHLREPEILERIKQQVRELYEENPSVHMTLAIARSKVRTEQVAGTITGVYPRIFTVEDTNSVPAKTHSVQYTDLLTGIVKLDELHIPQE